MNQFSTKAPKKPCPWCEGRGELYDGAPDAEGTPTEECSECKGTGRAS